MYTMHAIIETDHFLGLAKKLLSKSEHEENLTKEQRNALAALAETIKQGNY